MWRRTVEKEREEEWAGWLGANKVGCRKNIKAFTRRHEEVSDLVSNLTQANTRIANLSQVRFKAPGLLVDTL